MADRTLSDIEVTARHRNRSEERNLEEKLAKIHKKFYNAKDTIKGETETLRHFVKVTSRTSGWSPMSLRPDIGEDVLLPTSAYRSRAQNSSNRESNKFQRPWAYTYAQASHNKVYKELHQVGTNSQKMLALRSQMSSVGHLTNSDENWEEVNQLKQPRLVNEVFSATGVNKVKTAWSKMPKFPWPKMRNVLDRDLANFEDVDLMREESKPSPTEGRHMARQVTKMRLVNRAKSALISSKMAKKSPEQVTETISKSMDAGNRESDLLAKNVSTVLGLKKSVDTMCGARKDEEEAGAEEEKAILPDSDSQRAKLTLSPKKKSPERKRNTKNEETPRQPKCSCQRHKVQKSISQVWTTSGHDGSSPVGNNGRRIASTGSSTKDDISSKKKDTDTHSLPNNTSIEKTTPSNAITNVATRGNVKEIIKLKNKIVDKNSSQNSGKDEHIGVQLKESLEEDHEGDVKEEKDEPKSNYPALLKKIDDIILKAEVEGNKYEKPFCENKIVAKNLNDKVAGNQENGTSVQTINRNNNRICERSNKSLLRSSINTRESELCTEIASVSVSNQIKMDVCLRTVSNGLHNGSSSVKEDKELRVSDTITSEVIRVNHHRRSIIDQCLDGVIDSTYSLKAMSKEENDSCLNGYFTILKSISPNEQRLSNKKTNLKSQGTHDIDVNSQQKPVACLSNKDSGDKNTNQDSTHLKNPVEAEPVATHSILAKSDQTKTETAPLQRLSSFQKFKKVRRAGSVIKYSNSFFRCESVRKSSVKSSQHVTQGDDVFTQIAKVLWHKVQVLRRYRAIKAARLQNIDNGNNNNNMANTWLARQGSIKGHAENSSKSFTDIATAEDKFESKDTMTLVEFQSQSENCSSSQKRNPGKIWEKAVSRTSLVHSVYSSVARTNKDHLQNQDNYNNNNNKNNNNIEGRNGVNSNQDNTNNNAGGGNSNANSNNPNRNHQERIEHPSSTHATSASQNIGQQVGGQPDNVNENSLTQDSEGVNHTSSQDSNKYTQNIIKPSRGLPPRPFDGKSHLRMPVTYHRGIRLPNYVSPQQRYKTKGKEKSRRGLSIRWNSAVGVMVNAHHYAPEQTTDTLLSRDARQRALTKMVEENNAKPEEEKTEVITRPLRLKIERFLTSVEQFCKQ